MVLNETHVFVMPGNSWNRWQIPIVSDLISPVLDLADSFQSEIGYINLRQIPAYDAGW